MKPGGTTIVVFAAGFRKEQQRPSGRRPHQGVAGSGRVLPPVTSAAAAVVVVAVAVATATAVAVVATTVPTSATVADTVTNGSAANVAYYWCCDHRYH